jgi:hypothetical protein
MKTNTPETDVAEYYIKGEGNYVRSDISRKLERERDEARQQRDRMATVLQSIRDGYGGQITDPDCNCEDCEFLTPIDEALQSLTTTWEII